VLLTRLSELQNLETQKQVHFPGMVGDIPETWSYGQGQLYDRTRRIVWLLRVTRRECTTELPKKPRARP